MLPKATQPFQAALYNVWSDGNILSMSDIRVGRYIVLNSSAKFEFTNSSMFYKISMFLQLESTLPIAHIELDYIFSLQFSLYQINETII